MKILAVVRIIVLALVLLSNGVAQAGDAQQENPLYVEARNLWQQISASSLDNGTKAPYGQRFGNLAAEQQSLWSLAGQVDSGACAGRCLDNYNNRVLTWQSNLQSFSNDARKVLDGNSCTQDCQDGQAGYRNCLTSAFTEYEVAGCTAVLNKCLHDCKK